MNSRCGYCNGKIKTAYGLREDACSNQCARYLKGKDWTFEKYHVRSPGSYMFNSTDWYRLLRKMDYRCIYCTNKFKQEKLTIEHIVPLSRGGTHSVGNVAPCCANCNRAKGNKTLVEWKAIRASPIYNHLVREYRKAYKGRQKVDLRIDIYGR